MSVSRLRSAVWFSAFLIAGSLWGAAYAEDALPPPGDNAPLLRLETGGPRSYVSGIGFSRDGKTLYASGWDKAVLAWNVDSSGRFQFSPGAALRVPTGAGLFGGLNTLAISEDGLWLATGGQGYATGISGQRDTGWVVPAGSLDVDSQLQQGLIYVFNLADRTTKLLRGHRGPVQSISFVAGASSPLLVSVAEERSDQSSGYRPVIRFWDLSTGSELAHLTSFPDAAGGALPALQGFRPGLAAWSYGATPRHTRVAIAWGDDQFRIWDVRAEQVTSARSNPNVLTALPLDRQAKRLLTGAHASIGVWSLGNASDRLAALKTDQFQPAPVSTVNNKPQNLVSASTLIPAGPNGTARAAVIVTRYLSAGRAEYRLVLLEIGKTLKQITEVPLSWTGEVRQPAIASSPDGARLALAGNDRDEIEVHLVSDLIAGRSNRGQSLSSAGLVFRDAVFAQSGGAWGLRLSTTASQALDNKSSLVTDFKGRTVEQATSNWAPAVADPQGWSIKPQAAEKLVIASPDGRTANIALEKGFVPTCQAVMPASRFCPVPLAAVGSHFRGQPRLEIFRADTGEPVRWCVNHTEKLNSLSFSSDGRMLVSTAEDRVVSVWSLIDLAEHTVGQHGRIAGLSVEAREGRLIVREAPSDLPLRAGDEIVGLRRSREIMGVSSAREFYEFVLGMKPGTNLEVTIRRGGTAQTATCAVTQAIDETKPLFSLFVSPASSGRDWQWIGWHPLGNFDARGDDVDGWLGWQFNTGETERPARYAAIGEYRDAFYRRDLLPGLIDAQALVTAAAVEDPKLSIWLEDSTGGVLASRDSQVPRITSGDLRIHAEVEGVSQRSIQSLEALIDDQVVATLRQTTDRQWTADLSGATWQRGRHRVSVRLKTKEREVADVVRVQYSPAAPRLRWTPGWNPREELTAESVSVKASIEPSNEPFEARLLIYQPGGGAPTILKTWNGRQALEIQESVPIPPGESRLELEAWNAGVAAADRAGEEIRQAVLARRSPPEAPRIEVATVLAVLADGTTKPIEPESLVYRSSVPRIRVRGQIAATANLSSAEIEVGSTRRQLAGFQSASGKQFTFDELVELEPGNHQLVVRSGVGDKTAETRLSVGFSPPVPVIADLKVEIRPLKPLPDSIAGYLDRVYFEGYHAPQATVSAVLTGQLDLAYAVQLTANDVPVQQSQVTVDRSNGDRHLISALVPLSGGRQAFGLKVSNAWCSEASLQETTVEFRRPPRVDEFTVPETVVGVPVDVRARVHSLIPLRSLRLTIDGDAEVPNVRFEQASDNPSAWTVTAGSIGLSEGEHDLTLSAANDDGVSLERVTRHIRMDKPRIAPPVLAILKPDAADSAVTVASPQLELQYRVDSKAPASLQVEVRGNAERVEVANLPVLTFEVPDGTVTRTQGIELFDGVNEITLLASNEGGFSEKKVLRVSCVRPAATVEIVSISNLTPQIRNDGTGYFGDAAKQAVVPLKGQVKLRGQSAGKQNLSARIWVNRFKLPTVPVVFDETRPDVGTFSADVVFNRATQNRIQVEVFSSEGQIASEVGSTNELFVDCLAPDQKQELYVLLLGTGDGVELRTKARTALQARALTSQQASQEVWASEVFSRIHVHDAMNAPAPAVQNRLRELIGKMHNNLRSGSQGSSHSVVMVLFQGKIVLMENDFALTTSSTPGLQTKALTGRILEEYLTRAYGAHLIFLDLAQSDQGLQKRDIWPRAPHLGIILANYRGDGNKPLEVQLISILQRSMPQSRLVRDLAVQIDQQYKLAERNYPGQIENVDFLKDVYDLRIGGGE